MPPPVVDPVPEPVPDPVKPNPVDPKPSGSVVGTMSDTPVTLSLDTHKPIHDYWSSQSSDVKALVDKDAFNAAVQTVKDAEMIWTQGKFGTSLRERNINLYYNYAVFDKDLTDIVLLSKAIGSTRWGVFDKYECAVTSYRNFFVTNKGTEADELATVFAPIFARFPSNATDKQKVEICVKEIVDRFDYETGTVGAGFDWLNGDTKGNCENYTRAASQILAAAGIPNIQAKGSVYNGAHAWLICLVDGSWCVVDATAAEYGYAATMTFGEHEQLYSYSHTTNNTDSIKVAKALIEASLS